ncbi:MAG: hypothetical protein VX464_18885 [Pseudomonadota bacterium]|nr:hypothetical protein [Pseudomonadota bacterium]
MYSRILNKTSSSITLSIVCLVFLTAYTPPEIISNEEDYRICISESRGNPDLLHHCFKASRAWQLAEGEKRKQLNDERRAIERIGSDLSFGQVKDETIQEIMSFPLRHEALRTDLLKQQARIHLLAGNFAFAKNLLTQDITRLEQKSRSDSSLYFLRALALVALGEFDAAKADLGLVETNDKNRQMVAIVRIVASNATGDYKEEALESTYLPKHIQALRAIAGPVQNRSTIFAMRVLGDKIDNLYEMTNEIRAWHMFATGKTARAAEYYQFNLTNEAEIRELYLRQLVEKGYLETVIEDRWDPRIKAAVQACAKDKCILSAFFFREDRTCVVTLLERQGLVGRLNHMRGPTECAAFGLELDLPTSIAAY